MLYISHRLKPWWLLVVVLLVLVGCTTTTTKRVEPDKLEITEPEPEPDSDLPPAVTDGAVKRPQSKRSGDSPLRSSHQVKSRAEKRVVQPVIQKTHSESLEPVRTDTYEASPTTSPETDPLTEQYRIDAPEFDPALSDENSESSASSEESETSDISESAETETANDASEHAAASESSTSRASSPSSDRAESAASSSESAQERTPEPETAEPQSASADKKETASSGSKTLSDEALAKEQISGGGSPSSEAPPPAEASPAGQEKDVPTASVTGAEPQSEPPKTETSAGAEAETQTGAGGGLNIPSEQPAMSDKIDHSNHDHRYLADQHVEGAEEEPAKKSKTLHWNMQRQVKKVVE